MRRLATVLLVSTFALTARAQVVILNDNVFQERMSTIRAAVQDSLTGEPLAFASVYVIPSKDTTISNFTLTDAKGEAKLDEVPFGNYVFHVEMMGYHPFVRERYFREGREDMGTIRLQVDEQFLQAAVVSDIGNPIVVKQDTVEFNAASFRVGANAMLGDLLKRMPGMEVTEDGKVTFNGAAIDKLTVGGRTFFFGDQSTALSNLPAAVVDKIRVIDRESEATRSSGLQDGSREKVLDVALKKEFEEGWFGNVGLKGGSTVGASEDGAALRDDRGLLWSGNALVSAYSEKDQLTVIGNAQNVNDSNGVIIMVSEDGEHSALGQGLSTAAQLGVNANTSRIRDVETTVAANYKYSDTDSGTRVTRTTYKEDGDLLSVTDNSGKEYAQGVSVDAEMKKEKGRVWFHLNPEFSYGRTDGSSRRQSETIREDTQVNRSESSIRSLETTRTAGISSDISFRDLGGKKGRIFYLELGGNYTSADGSSDEGTLLEGRSGATTRNMRYGTDRQSYTTGGELRFTEPFGAKWTLSALTSLHYSHSDRTRDAFDATGWSEYFSSVSRNDNLRQQYELTAQYKFLEQSWITLGARLSGIENKTFSRSYGVEETTGEGEWNWFLTPTLRIQHSHNYDRFSFSLYGSSIQPGSYQMQPVLNISDPSRLSLGNIYLRPYSYSYLYGTWSRNNREKFSTLMVFFNGRVTYNAITSAQWYDAGGILYSIPVNVRRPSVHLTLGASYTTPLDAKKLWSLTVGGNAVYTVTAAYQARTTLEGPAPDSFDYSAFMAGFWGDSASGSRFYGGNSGFSESMTHYATPSVNASVKYNQDHYSFTVGAATTGRIARYSLDPGINMNTLDTRLTARGTYTTRHEFEFNTDLAYAFYRGYAAGYGDPEWRWNAEVSKNIGAFNLSVKVHDIFNQTRSLTHLVTADYEEDSYRLIMGRYVLFGVKWNFGKMNTVHSHRAQQAAWKMLW
ncbi:MAG: outer membrane beta-barrel protein [Bacteroidales bacterium]|nr:outer membrane beta-barrel protein [Bacteroidales bacterium]